MSVELVIFDLDGVLVDAREIHYHALNEALALVDEKYVISREEHLTMYDGLPTRKKLQLLSKSKDLPESLHAKIAHEKQVRTIKLSETMGRDHGMREVLRKLKSDGKLLYCATNSVRQTMIKMLSSTGLIEYFDGFYSNEDVKNPKPHPEVYWRCMIDAKVGPDQTVIVEDSQVGRKGAIASGGILCAVKDRYDVSYEKIAKVINNNAKNERNSMWDGSSMNIVIPMAGRGSRFAEVGYTFPKPLIDVAGKPMIQRVVENLNIKANYIFIVQKEHYDTYNLKYLLNLIAPECKIIQIEGITEGAACTVLLAEQHIDNDNPLLVVNSDQVFEWDSSSFMYSMVADDVDGGILTFTATHPKWSYAKLDEDGYVCEVAEKKPISDIATAGAYYWKHGKDFVGATKKMISKNVRVNNEFYVCPVYNEAIEDGKKIKVSHIERMWGLGTPEDLDYYLKNCPEVNR